MVTREPGKGSFCLAHHGVLVCVASFPAAEHNMQLDEDLSLCVNTPFSKQTYKERRDLVSEPSVTLSMANTPAIIIERCVTGS